MKKIKLVYNDKKDKEFVSLIETKTPFFVDFIDMNTIDGRKEGFKILNYWGAKTLPFIVVEDTKKPVVFYSEIGELATNQFIKWLNESKN